MNSIAISSYMSINWIETDYVLETVKWSIKKLKNKLFLNEYNSDI